MDIGITGSTFTDAAVQRVKILLENEKNPELKLRVFVQGGGCSGFEYGFAFDEAQEMHDFVFEKEGVKFLVDPMSYQYLAGAEVDYMEETMGSRFVVRNPNAIASCGCGSSFSV